jgi:hypothetical protein
MIYLLNRDLDKIKEEGYETVGNPGLIVSGTSIDHLPSFRGEIINAVREENPDLIEIEYSIDYAIAVFYKNHKDKKSNLEKITKTCGGKILEDQHFYIVQPLKKK